MYYLRIQAYNDYVYGNHLVAVSSDLNKLKNFATEHAITNNFIERDKKIIFKNFENEDQRLKFNVGSLILISFNLMCKYFIDKIEEI